MARLQRGHIDQIAQAVDTIKNNPDSRRIMVSAWMWPTYLNASPPAVPWPWRASSLNHFMHGVVDGVVAELAWRGGRCASCLHWHRPRQPCASRGWSWCPTHIRRGARQTAAMLSLLEREQQRPRRFRGSPRGRPDATWRIMPTLYTRRCKWARVVRSSAGLALGRSPPHAPDYKHELGGRQVPRTEAGAPQMGRTFRELRSPS